MRDRVPNDWVVDLAGRHQLEATLANAIDQHRQLELLENSTNRFDRLDYTVATQNVPAASVELKAKWQPYRGWQQHRPDVEQVDLFIIDELALRRLMTAAPHSYLIVCDYPMERWVLYGAADLLLAPKGRVSRRIKRQRQTARSSSTSTTAIRAQPSTNYSMHSPAASTTPTNAGTRLNPGQSPTTKER